MKKKILIFVLIIVAVSAQIFIPYNKEKAAEYATENALPKSHKCCAWYVMKAVIAGGKPCIILPAWGYKYYLPYIGFRDVTSIDYNPEVGDIAVFPYVPGHEYGHIAIWNGTQWVSDFKQNHFIVASGYKDSDYHIYRYK